MHEIIKMTIFLILLLIFISFLDIMFDNVWLLRAQSVILLITIGMVVYISKNMY